VEHHVAGDGHGVLKISLDFVEDVFGGAAEEDRACFGYFALGEESKVFVADLFDFKESALCAYV